jgi:hypothetical protein
MPPEWVVQTTCTKIVEVHFPTLDIGTITIVGIAQGYVKIPQRSSH